MTLKIIKGTGAQTYSPWPGTGAAINFGYQPPEILHTDTTNTAPSNVLIELIGTNFGVDQSVATVYICQSGTVNPDQLCFAAGDPKNGPHAASIPMVETDVSVWDHTTIRIQPQNNRTFNKNFFKYFFSLCLVFNTFFFIFNIFAYFTYIEFYFFFR